MTFYSMSSSKQQPTAPSKSPRMFHRDMQELTRHHNLPYPSPSHLVTLHRPVPLNMTPREMSFHHQPYSIHEQPAPPQSYKVTSPLPSLRHSSLQISPHHSHKHDPGSLTSLPYRPISPPGPKYSPHPFQASNSIMARKPEPISWIKYPVEPHHIYPGPYAAVDLPFEDVNNNPSAFEVPKSKKGKLSSTWGPQKAQYMEKSRKCVRFASTWGPAHPAPPGNPGGRAGEYATINPRKLTSRYVRPAVFRRTNLKE